MGVVITLLSDIKSPEDLKKIPQKKIPILEDEIRRTIVDAVSKNGGHLASNLGVVELTIALHRVFDSPKDAIIWDVSHQCYAHKLLTGRYENFNSLRQFDGISGFTKKSESVHDFFDNGHSSTSISQALGLLTANEIVGREGKVIAVIGDGALTGGMAFEAISNVGQLAKNLIIILNDNQMSIDHNTGSISSYLSRLTMTSSYQIFRHSVDYFISKLPANRFLTKFVFRFKRSLKGLLLSTNLFSDLGCEYVGPLNGSDEKELEIVLQRVKKMVNPVVVHIVTKKGKGYSPAEDHPDRFHGVGPFSISDGTVEQFNMLSFTESFSNSLLSIAKKRNDIVAITAAMAKGTGLASFARHFPNRFFDVGIAEEHAVTFAGGLSRGGLIPVICIYSTFVQRAVDQIIHDIALQELAAVLVLDRAGPVPNDGETHQGLFDIALFLSIPKIEILSPVSSSDLNICLEYAVNQKNLVIIRYPKLTCPTEHKNFSIPIQKGRGLFLTAGDFAPELELSEKKIKTSKKVLFASTGGMYSEVLVAARSLLLENIPADIFICRFIKPFDFDFFYKIACNYDSIVLCEDGIKTSGFAQWLYTLCLEAGLKNVFVKAFPEKFYKQGTREQICMQAGMTSEDLKNQAKQGLSKSI